MFSWKRNLDRAFYARGGHDYSQARFNGLGIECLALVNEFKSTLKRAEDFPSRRSQRQKR